MDYLNKELDHFMELGGKLGISHVQCASDVCPGGKFLKFAGREVIDFTRLDYLALGENPEIRAHMQQSIADYDISCPASQFVFKSGSNVKLEKKLATLHKLEDSLVFTSGFSVNINMMEALGLRLRVPHLNRYAKNYKLGKETRDIPTVFIVDADSHYSLIHGIRITSRTSYASCFSYFYKGGNLKRLEGHLKEIDSKFGDKAVKVIVSDALCSSSGKLFNVKKLYEIALDHNALLYLDEAHSVGALGPNGGGVSDIMLSENVDRKNLIVMGTLTKTFSQLGGYAAFGDERLLALVRACSPQYIFSAPVLPWMAETLCYTLDLFAGTWGKGRRKILSERAKELRDKLQKEDFNTLGSESHIVPVLIGDENKCQNMKQELLQEGFNVACFFFPAVAKGYAVIRISVCADITSQDIDDLVNALCRISKKEPATEQN
jgi:7-keto-8-aminopelargonate synthetase-like enzyme